jgi:hypothetical protein
LRRDSADIRDVDPDPVMMKFATSAANVLGKKYVSSETFTWLAEHFKVSLSQCKPELEQVFMAGVNHVFYHGTTYSPEVAGWPGWLFYASVQFGPVNSFWPHVKGLNEYIARTQSILQQGNADTDVLIYWPVFDVWNDAGRLDKQISIHNIDEWLHPTQFYQLSTHLMDNGYLIDFASDDIVAQLNTKEGLIQATDQWGRYKTLIIPACKLMPLKTLNSIMELAEGGATVVFEDWPKDVPGYHNLDERREELQQKLKGMELVNGEAAMGKGKIILSSQIDQTLSKMNLQGEALARTGLKFVRRVIDGDRYYYIVNHTPDAFDEVVALNTNSEAVIFMDPDHDRFGAVNPVQQDSKSSVRIQLESGKSIIIRCTNGDVSQIPAWEYVSQPQVVIALDGNWELSFAEGGPEIPEAVSLNNLTSWTNLEDANAGYFSGTGVYEYELELTGQLADEYILDLGQVAESARLWVNDQEVDFLWGIPFRIRIGDYLKTGQNTIKVEVANLMANRIRYMDQQGMEWRKFHEINFVNIDYEPFDASGWAPMPSGLLGPVVLEGFQVE